MHPRIALIGLPASGKSSVGPQLAKLLAYSYADLDQLLCEQQACSIGQLFEQFGQSAFRSLESALLQDYAHRDGFVVATGGGSVELESSRLLLRNAFFSVWLDVEPNTAWFRSRGSDRPLLANGGQQAMEELYARRLNWYRECSRLTIQVASKSVQQIAEEIHGCLR